MTSRKEERERLRAERLAAQKSATSDERRRLILGYFVAGVLGALVIAGIVVAVMNAGGGGSGEEAEANEAAGFDPNTGFKVPSDIRLDEREGTPPPELQQGDLDAAAKAADCELMQDLPEEGNTHIAPDAKTPEYETSPPTSGDHSPEQMADGAYLETPPLINTVHSLEHGRIEIQYDPDLPEEDQLALKGLFDSDPQGMLMFPNPDMPYEVAATTWTNMIGCENYSPEVLDAITDFRDTYRGQGPENIPF